MDAVDKLKLIQERLKKTALRRRLERTWNGLWSGLLWGAGCWVVLLSLYKVLPLSDLTLAIGGGLWAAMIVIGMLWGWWKKETLMEVARWLDLKNDLKEQLSTALEFSEKADNRWRELLLEKAAARVREFDWRAVIRFHVPRVAGWGLLLMAIGAAVGFVPEYRSPAYVQKQREKELVREAGQHLVMLTRKSLESHPTSLEPTRKSLESVEELGREFARAKLTRSDALKDVAKISDKIKDDLKQMAANPAFKNMEKAARNPTDGADAGTAEAQKQLESLQKAMSKSGKEDALEKMKQDLKKAQAAAAGMKSSGGADDAQKEALSAALASLAASAEQAGWKLPELQQAMEALAAAKVDQVLKDLQMAELELDKLQKLAKKLEQMTQPGEKAGKDLAEQLDRGQAEMAESRLRQMAQQLKSAELTPEQMQKILEEVNKALPSAKEYGKVQEFLKRGADQMKSGSKKDAGDSLKAAADELGKLMQEMQDAQTLMASLDALQKAELSIGTGQCWGMGKSNRIGAGMGKKPGTGVGTWGDDNLWLDNPQNELWDNSGVARPDQDARGLSDRGEGKVPDSKLPTKIKGKITPGGPMPSITLKGLSLKGTSKVAVEQMVEAAQTEAQSALSQEKVPRAYQSAVREYFDELKP